MVDESFSFEKGIITLNRELTALDILVRDFLSALGSEYLVMSGFVTILSGRTRATEDVDILVPQMPLGRFVKLFNHYAIILFGIISFISICAFS